MIKESTKNLMKGIFLIAVVATLTFFSLSSIASIYESTYFGDSIFSSQRNYITGLAISQQNQITEEDLAQNSLLNNYDTLIMNVCSSVHYRASDCFYMIKSIISVTSEGDPSYVGDRGIGLVPMRTTDQLDEQDLINPETNLRHSARHIMRLYDVYRGDLTFTSLAYFSGRALSNEILYEFQKDPSNVEDAITRAQVNSLINRVYERIDRANVEHLPEKSDILNFYNDLLVAFLFWTGRPVVESSPSNIVFDTGTYSIRPSFSAEVYYNIREVEFIHNLINGFIQDSKTRDKELVYSNLVRYIRNNYDAEYSERVRDIISLEDTTDSYHSWNNPEDYIETNNLIWRSGSCNPILSGFESFVMRFMDCLHSVSNNCYCDFSDIIIYPGHYIKINFSSATHEADGIRKRIMHIGFYNDDDELVSEHNMLVNLQGSLERNMQLGILRNDVKTYSEFNSVTSFEDWEFSFALRRFDTEGSWVINGNDVSNKFLKSTFSSGVDAIGFAKRNNNFGFEDSCNVLKSFEKMCVISNNTEIYHDDILKYAPISYGFAFSINPKDLEDEIFPEHNMYDKDPFHASIAGTVLEIEPLVSCRESDFCSEEIILGKAAHYHNTRENIIIHSLPFDTNIEARNNFVSFLTSEATFNDWIDEKHKSVHYLIDDNGNVQKLVREDSTVQFTKCFDGSSIHLGLTGNNKFSLSQLSHLVKLVFEIMARNAIPLENIIFNDDLQKPRNFPVEYSCDFPREFSINNEEFKQTFFSELEGVITQKATGVVEDSETLSREYLSRRIHVLIEATGFFGDFYYYPKFNDFCEPGAGNNPAYFSGEYHGIPRCLGSMSPSQFTQDIDLIASLMREVPGVSGTSNFDVFMSFMLLAEEGQPYYYDGLYLERSVLLEIH